MTDAESDVVILLPKKAQIVIIMQHSLFTLQSKFILDTYQEANLKNYVDVLI